MENLRTLRNIAVSFELAAALLGAGALLSSASAQNYGSGEQPYWSGAPNATGPAGVRAHHRHYGRYAGGYLMEAEPVAQPALPYWSGAPNAAGPAGLGYANNGPLPFLFAPVVAVGTVVGGAVNAAGDVVGAAGNTAGAVVGGPYYSSY